MAARYTVVYERTPRNFSAYVPDLPGCVATGSTRRQVEQRIRDAIERHIDELRRERRRVPRPLAWTEDVEVPA